MMEIVVYGRPAPQGSKRHVGRGIMVEASKAVAPWRQDVKAAAMDIMRQQPGSRLRGAVECAAPPLTGPLWLMVVFTLPKPKNAPKRRRTWPDKRPDLDKLVRSTLDGLTDVAFADDAQVVCLRAAKIYLGDEDALRLPGARIQIEEVTG